MSRYFRVGLFIVATLLVLVIGIFLIGSKDLRFRSTYRIKTQFQNVSGLQAGAAVRVGGIQQGTIARIVLPSHPDGKVTVVMDLDRSTRDIVNRGSIASVESEGLLGDKFVEVSFGSAGGPPLRDGDTIGSVPPIDISDLVKQANQILGSTDRAVRNVEATSQNLENVTSKVDSGQGTVGALINDKALYQRVNAAAADFQENMEAFKHNFLVRGFFQQRGYEDSSELAQHRIARLPSATPAAEYAFDDSKIFDKPDSAKLRNQKLLHTAGEYLEQNRFSLAVVMASEGPKGDTDKDRTLSAARAAVVRDYLVANFRVDDTRIKTLPLGKTATAGDAAKVEVVAYTGPSASQSR